MAQTQILVLTFLEWLNWHGKGTLRVTPGRLVWCGEASEALRSALHFAPDLEPADDGFLLAEATQPPRVMEGGHLVLSFDDCRFYALSERSMRLLEPGSERMKVQLTLASTEVQRAWSDWKSDYRRGAVLSQARRLWSWALGRPWPGDDAHEKLLLRSVELWAEMRAALEANSKVAEHVPGTSLAAWMPMVMRAESLGLLSSDREAHWRRMTHAHFMADRGAETVSASFWQRDDPTWEAARDALPLTDGAMLELAAVATGAHHALRAASNQDPDLSALTRDLAALQIMTADHEPERAVSTALLSLGGILPSSTVTAFITGGLAQAGWAAPRAATKDELARSIELPAEGSDRVDHDVSPPRHAKSDEAIAGEEAQEECALVAGQPTDQEAGKRRAPKSTQRRANTRKQAEPKTAALL